MKNILVCILFLPIVSKAQFAGFFINFDSNENVEHLYIDTSANPNNIWQIGIPDKPNFYNPSFLKAIVTDTISPYPINDTSSFIIWAVFEPQTIHDFSSLSAKYKVHSDSLNDYGKIEFSSDFGDSWVLISDDTMKFIQGLDTIYWPKICDTYNNEWDDIQLTGTSTDVFKILFYQTDFWGTQFFNFQVDDFQNYFNLAYGDTMLFRFTFIADGNAEIMDGLLFDDIAFEQEYPTGIEENDKGNIIIYPNPVKEFITFPVSISTIQITSLDGVIVYIDYDILDNQIQVEHLNKGLYFVQVKDILGNSYSTKFIKL